MAATASFVITNWPDSSGQFVAPFMDGIRTTNHGLEVDAAPLYPQLVSTGAYDLTGSTFSVEVRQTPNIDNGSTELYFGLWLESVTPSNKLELKWGNGNWFLSLNVAGVRSDVGLIVFDPVAHRYIRLREASGTLYAEYSADSITWTLNTSVANPFAVTALYPIFGAGNWNAAVNPGMAIYGAVNATNLSVPATVLAVAGTASGLAPAASVAAGASVTAVAATGVSSAPAPTVLGAQTASVGSLVATGTASAGLPVVSGGSTVAPPASSGTSQALPPTVSVFASAVVGAVRATATGSAPVPLVKGAARPQAFRAQGTALARVPIITTRTRNVVVEVSVRSRRVQSNPSTHRTEVRVSNRRVEVKPSVS